MLYHISHALRHKGTSFLNPSLKEGLMGRKPVTALNQTHPSHKGSSSNSQKTTAQDTAEDVGIVAGGVIGGMMAIGLGFEERPSYLRNSTFEKEHKIFHRTCQSIASMIWAIPLVPAGALGGWVLGLTFRYTAPVGLAGLAIAGAGELLGKKEDVKNQ